VLFVVCSLFVGRLAASTMCSTDFVFWIQKK
jgi:hypothetical protein